MAKMSDFTEMMQRLFYGRPFDTVKVTIMFLGVSIQMDCSLFTICGDACPLSCVNAEACLTRRPNAWGRRGGGS